MTETTDSTLDSGSCRVMAACQDGKARLHLAFTPSVIAAGEHCAVGENGPKPIPPEGVGRVQHRVRAAVR